MTKVESREELEPALEEAFKWDHRIIAEAFVTGREITVGVLGNQVLEPLPVVEICPGEGHNFFDYQAKYTPGATREICPAPLDGDLTTRAQELGMAAHRALRLRGYSRTDMIITAREEIFIIETNTIPGMTPTSLLPQAAAQAGLTFPRLLDRLIELALESGSSPCPEG